MLYFVDESGIDLKEAPCSVLAGVGMPEAKVWPFAQAFQGLKQDILQVAVDPAYEAKGAKLLTRRVFQQARLGAALPREDRNRALSNLHTRNERGENAGFYELLAIAQAKLAFTEAVLKLAQQYGAVAFASVVPREAPQQRDRSFLRKDFSYLFERIHCHVCDGPKHDHGVMIFDEQDRALSQRLLDQINRYFAETDRGKQRAKRMIPMPFFVHSDLTPAIQLADIVAYVLNWGLSLPKRQDPVRAELQPFAKQVLEMSYKGREVRVQKTSRRRQQRGKPIKGITYIEDLRPSKERSLDKRLAAAEQLDAA
jgi:Protein of unknown function (DUF3800)